jgi:putative FmdB family regulatory protein
MPTYDFRCKQCGHEFELFQSMKDKPRGKCPECGAEAKRLISGGAGLIFKGSGFYITDYKNKATPASTGPVKKTDAEKPAPKAKETKEKSSAE